MSREEAVRNDKKYYTVHDGTFRVQVPETHPDAVARNWETSDGKSGTKYERHVKALFGKITSIQFQDGDYGKNLRLTLDENEDGISPVLSFSVDGYYGPDLMKKLPNVNPDTEYRFMPFDFVGKTDGKRHRGIAVTSADGEGKFKVKVPSFFYDEATKKFTNGFPEATEEDKDDWAFYFKKVSKFLVKYIEENVQPKYASVAATPDAKADDVKYPEEEINPEDIPF